MSSPRPGVSVIVPARNAATTLPRCLDALVAQATHDVELIVVDDASPEPKLSAWVDGLNQDGIIQLIRSKRNQGFVASANAGMQAAGAHDVVLLNSDTEVANGWLARLAGHAYATPRVASVSPFSNDATICEYPGIAGGPPAFSLGPVRDDGQSRSRARSMSSSTP